MKRINTEQIHTKQNSVFVAFYTDALHHYQENPECKSWGDDIWYSKFCLLAAVMRWDGSLGFIGGKVDNNESLLDALKREVKEEANFDISELKYNPVCSHLMNEGLPSEQHTHLYAIKLTSKQIYNLRDLQSSASHSKIESAGINVLHMIPETIGNLYKNQWAGTALLELKILVTTVINPMIIEIN